MNLFKYIVLLVDNNINISFKICLKISSFYLFTFANINKFIYHLSIHLSGYMYICLSLYLSIYLCINLNFSIYLSIRVFNHLPSFYCISLPILTSFEPSTVN